MSAPRNATTPSGWYGSGARRRTVTMDDAQRMSNSAWVTSSRLMSGLILYTGLGWLISRWVGHQALLMAIGAMVGLGLSYYLVFTSLAQETRAAQQRKDDARPDRTGTTMRGTEEPGVS